MVESAVATIVWSIEAMKRAIETMKKDQPASGERLLVEDGDRRLYARGGYVDGRNFTALRPGDEGEHSSAVSVPDRSSVRTCPHLSLFACQQANK